MEIVLIAIVAAVLLIVAKSFMKFEVEVVSINQESLEVEAQLIVALLAKVAKADGRVCELEAELLKITLDDFSSTFPNRDEMRQVLKSVYEREITSLDNLAEVAQNLYSLTKSNYPKRLKILEYLINMAFIDREFSAHEEDVLITIAENLEIKQEHFIAYLNTFKAMYEKYAKNENQNIDRAYAILGVSRSDPFEHIKKQYRTLVKEHHPDIITGKGLGEDEVQKATIKLQEINSAYELIKKDKGV